MNLRQTRASHRCRWSERRTKINGNRGLSQASLCSHELTLGCRSQAHWRKREVGVDLARVLDNSHAETPRQAHHRPVFPEKLHRDSRCASIACVCNGTRQQRSPYPATAVRRMNRQPDLGAFSLEGDVHCTDQRAVIIVDAEHSVAIEIDAVDVGANSFAAEWRPESEPAVGDRQRKEVRSECFAHAAAQTLERNAHHRALDAIRRQIVRLSSRSASKATSWLVR